MYGKRTPFREEITRSRSFMNRFSLLGFSLTAGGFCSSFAVFMPPKLCGSDSRCSLRRQRKEFPVSGIFFGSQSTVVPVSILIFILSQGLCSGRGTEKGEKKPLPMWVGRKWTELDLRGPWSPVAGDVKVKNPLDPSLGGAKVKPWVASGDVKSG